MPIPTLLQTPPFSNPILIHDVRLLPVIAGSPSRSQGTRTQPEHSNSNCHFVQNPCLDIGTRPRENGFGHFSQTASSYQRRRVVVIKRQECRVDVDFGLVVKFFGLDYVVFICVIILGGNPYGPKIHVHSTSLSLDDAVSSSWIAIIGEITFNLSISFFPPMFDNNTDVSIFYGKKLLSLGFVNSSAPVEFLFPANAKGNLQLLREDERRGSELGSRRTSWISIKARYDDPPKRDWGDEAYYR
ncbi:hypothetical protein RHMOL_Rhmol03G0018700 [Rhododendron molle]|uniref:Uncharacterized protein n=1 Tax=Rhododendron molle TaxID=49168 RepID=A0ACC0PB39_RHOML|nr:hypothetical protein RHMOL_Rhmol03G0018700 [Rhododendron molle]